MEFWCLNVNRLKSQNQPAKIWFQIFSSQAHCSFKIYRTFSWSKTLNIIERYSHICAARYFLLMNLSTKELVRKDVFQLGIWNYHNTNCAKNMDRLYALDLLFNITE